MGYDIARGLAGVDGHGPRGNSGGVKKTGAAVFALQGELGAGKTTFVQGFLKGLGSKKRVTSPTFVLMRRHVLSASARGPKNIFHIDAYRLKKPEHLASLELDVILNGPRNVVLIEWPEQAKRFLPKDTVWLQFKYGKKENERTIVITRPAHNVRKK